MVKVGLLGSGFIANVYMETFREIPNAEIAAVCSKTPSHVENFAKRWGIPKTYTEMENLVRDPEVEVAVVLLPHHLHREATLLAAENGKHVICEKILGRNAKEAKEMLDVVRRAGIIHCYAECIAFAPYFKRIKEIIDKGGIGRVWWVRGMSKLDIRLHPLGFRDDPELCGGGVLSDTGPHIVEYFRKFIEDPPIEAFAYGDTMVYKERFRAEDNAILLVKHAGGQIGQAEVSWSAIMSGLTHKLEVFGDKGSIAYPHASMSPIECYTLAGIEYVMEKAEVKKGLVFPAFEEHRVHGFYNMLKHFLDCIEKGKMPTETYEDGYIVNEIIDAGYRSMKSRKWEKIKIQI